MSSDRSGGDVVRLGRIPSRALDELAALPVVKRGVRAVAVKVRDDAAQHAPRLTGALRRSLVVVEARNPRTGRLEYLVGWNTSVADYGKWVELGTSDTRAQPHLRPAAKRAKRR